MEVISDTHHGNSLITSFHLQIPEHFTKEGFIIPIIKMGKLRHNKVKRPKSPRKSMEEVFRITVSSSNGRRILLL